MSKNIDKIIELDNELTQFLDKYGSKLSYSLEMRLNREWKKDGKGEKFRRRAHEIFKQMNNTELLLTIASTKYVFTIVNVIDYFTEFKLDFDTILNGDPELLVDAFFLMQKNDAILAQYTPTYYWYEKIKEKNKLEEIERFILTKMSNAQLMELSRKSKRWQDRLYLYGFLADGKD